MNSGAPVKFSNVALSRKHNDKPLVKPSEVLSGGVPHLSCSLVLHPLTPAPLPQGGEGSKLIQEYLVLPSNSPRPLGGEGRG